ncbi:MAG: polysaccharide deacetylase family protein [Deltaproteobacteria bacterium]|nr:polysaccharide deacetylase family protein [Deltaproteobacteria bacterium]
MGPDGTKWARVSGDFARDSRVLGRAALRASLRGSFLSLAGSVARSPGGDFLHCLYLHGVYDDQVENFRRLLEGLLEIGHFVDTEEVFRVLAGTTDPRGCSFHLSFDDGFDNNHRNALPVLEELGIRAAFFVPSGLVGAPDDYVLEQWWLPECTPTRFMSWQEVGELHRAGHEIGSHTRTHARLSQIGGVTACVTRNRPWPTARRPLPCSRRRGPIWDSLSATGTSSPRSTGLRSTA